MSRTLRLLAAVLAAFAPAVLAQRAAPALPDGPHVLAFLNRTIAWNERLDAQALLADQPTDVLPACDRYPAA